MKTLGFEKKTLLVFSTFLILFSLVAVVFAVQQTAVVVPASQFNTSSTIQAFNFSIANLNVSHLVQQINITLPTGFTYVTSSAFSNVSFNNGSIVLAPYNASTNVTWENTTNYVLNTTEAGNFSFLVSIAPGSYSTSFLVTTLDNQSTRVANVSTVAVAITVDIIAPTPTSTNPALDYTNISITTQAFNASYNDTLTDISACLFQIDGVNQTTNILPAGGTNYTCGNTSVGLTTGTHLYRFWMNDTLGNMAATAARTLTVDPVAPTPTSTNPALDYTNISITTQAFNASYNDTLTDISKCIFQIDGVNVTTTDISAAGGTNYTCGITRTSLTVAVHSYKFWMNDTLGNMNATESRTLTVDNVQPDLGFGTANPANRTNISSTTQAFNASYLDGLTDIKACLFEIDGVNATGDIINTGAFAYNCSITNTTMTTGVHTYKFWMNDTLGNMNVTPTRWITRDNVQPNIAFAPSNQVDNANVSSASVTFNATVSDALTAITGCILQGIGSNNTFNPTATGATTAVCNVTNSSIVDGTYTYRIWSNDTLGNLNSTPTRNLTVATTQPSALAFASPTLSNTTNQTKTYIYVNLTFTHNNPHYCILEWAGINETINLTGSGSSAYCYANKTSLSDSAYAFRVWVNTTAGLYNVSQSRTVRVDTTAPTVSVSTSPTSVSVGYALTISCSASDSGAGVSNSSLTGTNPSGNAISVSCGGTYNPGLTGTYTLTYTATDGASQSATATTTFTATGIGGGDGGAAAPAAPAPSPAPAAPTPTTTVVVAEVTPTAPATVAVTNPDVAVSQINIEVTTAASNVQITVSSPASVPVAAPAATTVYKYIQIEKTNLPDASVKSAKIKFQVEKSWLTANNLNEADVVLNRYTNAWTALSTTKLSSDANNVYYEAASPGFSYFAITAKPKAAAPTNVTPTPAPAAAPAPTYALPTISTNTWMMIGVAAIALICIAAGALVYRKKKAKGVKVERKRIIHRIKDGVHKIKHRHRVHKEE